MMWDDERALPLLLSHDSYVSPVDTVDVSDYRGSWTEVYARGTKLSGYAGTRFRSLDRRGLRMYIDLRHPERRDLRDCSALIAV